MTAVSGACRAEPEQPPAGLAQGQNQMRSQERPDDDRQRAAEVRPPRPPNDAGIE